MGSEYSKETLLWKELIGKILSNDKRCKLAHEGKMITYKTDYEFIQEMKSKYYLDLMKHGK